MVVIYNYTSDGRTDGRQI